MLLHYVHKSIVFWFDSGIKSHPYGRYSFVGCDPYKIYHPNDQQDIFSTLENDVQSCEKKL